MSTRCTIHFGHKRGQSTAIVYRHSDGYPSGMGADFTTFFDAVEAQTNDTRYSDPSYLAAKFVVWLAGEFAISGKFVGDEYVSESHRVEAPLRFLSVGILDRDPGDIEYRYWVICKDGNRPEVLVQARDYDKGHKRGDSPYFGSLLPVAEAIKADKCAT